MEGELYEGLYRLLQVEATHHHQPPRQQYSDCFILEVFFWAVLHDRPVCWACRSVHWPAEQRWRTLPSPATMSRRMRTLSVMELLRQVWLALQEPRAALCRRIDTKPLTVGGFSKDRDARRGYATGALARGYKVSCIWGLGVVPEAVELGSLRDGDPTLAAEALGQVEGEGYLLGDQTHDSNALFERAGMRGLQLVAPRRKPGSDLGHRGHSPWRLRSIELLEGPSGFGRGLYRGREQIERDFGGWTSFGGGLQPLPSWVRTPHRVRNWVVGKLVINGLRLRLNQGLAA